MDVPQRILYTGASMPAIGLGTDPSPDIIHDQKTIYGSWDTSIWLTKELRLMASGRCGKVAVCFDEELAS